MNKLAKNLTISQGVVLAICTIIGSGLLGLPGIAIDRGAHPTRNAGQRFQSLKPAVVGIIHQILQHCAGTYSHYAPVDVDLFCGVAQKARWGSFRERN